MADAGLIHREAAAALAIPIYIRALEAARSNVNLELRKVAHVTP
jgi:hypothetical protein